jgi:subtilisin family serine protease
MRTANCVGRGRQRHARHSTTTLRTRHAVESLESRRLLSGAADYLPGELLVTFKPGVGPGDIANFYAKHGLGEKESLDLHARAGAAHLKLVNVPAAKTLQLASSLSRDPRVAYAEPNYLMTVGAATPTDTQYPVQWNLNNTGQWSPSTPDADIDAPEAWKITTGSPDVYVAVIDTGVDYTHPALAANMWTNPGEVAGDGIDNDGNGYADDVHGYDFVNKDGDPMDDYFHGTGCAGIIGASPFNDVVTGVAWRVGIIAVKAGNAEGSLSTSDVVKAFQYVNYLKNVQGVNIVATNNSYGGPGNFGTGAMRDAMAGVDQPGMSPILHVAAAHNFNESLELVPRYPASFDLDNIVSVAATDWNDQIADFSNYGATSVDLAAPGVQIESTDRNGDYFYTFAGTSAAAPHVTGVAALVASAFPGISAAQMKQRILAGVDPIGHIGTNAAKPTLTNGRLNAARALAGASVESDTKAPTAVANLAASGIAFQGVSLTWTASGDDGTAGRAGFYDVRYATSPISSRTWDTATRALGEPGPKAAGAAESFSVSGLDPAKTYYFALKVRDNMGNESPLSNVAQAGTSAATTLFSDNMENGTNGWTASGLWHQSHRRVNSPTTSWYYGVEATGTYDTGAANSGLLTSPLIDLRKTGSRPVLIYREWRQMEDVVFLDTARVQVSAGGSKWNTVDHSEFSTAIDPLNWQPSAAEFGWQPTLKSKFSASQWVSNAVDLSAYAGQTIRIRFLFDTVDASHNNFEGWYVDDVNVYTAAAPSAAPLASGATFSAAPVLGPERVSAWSRLEASGDEEKLPELA